MLSQTQTKRTPQRQGPSGRALTAKTDSKNKRAFSATEHNQSSEHNYAENVNSEVVFPTPKMKKERVHTYAKVNDDVKNQQTAAMNSDTTSKPVSQIRDRNSDIKTKEAADDATESDATELSSSEDEGEKLEPIFFAAECEEPTYEENERDALHNCCRTIAYKMRKRVTLPAKSEGVEFTDADLDIGFRLPLYSCPWGKCSFHTNDRELFLHHIAGGARDEKHLKELIAACGVLPTWITYLDLVLETAALKERERWPQLGLSVTRRSLNSLCARFNDAATQCLCCFICGQLRTTCTGYPKIDLEQADAVASNRHSEIHYLTTEALVDVGARAVLFFFFSHGLGSKLF